MPVAYDAGLVAEVLGEQALPLDLSDRTLAPFLTVDDRIHGPTSDFLREHCASKPNLSTARRIASDLGSWLSFLTNDCGLPPFEDRDDPVLLATEEHFARYYRLRQYGAPEDGLSAGGWSKAASSLKRLYQFMLRRYQHPPPFQIVSFTRPGGGTGTMIAKYRPRRRKTGSAGVPLTPEFAELLLMGALRVDLDGRQDPYRGADRDHAILSLGLAAGLRRNNLANLTTYEVPARSSLPITVMGVADRITKGDAGGDALVFSHRLPSVHDYMAGARAELVSQRPHRPRVPLQIVEEDSVRVRFEGASEQGTITRRWSDVDEDQRRRLVNPDGTSPILFLNENTGRPLAYSTYQHVAHKAVDFVRERVNPDFPARFRLHDLRHTYAVHLTVAIYLDVVASSVQSHRRDDWTVDRIINAVDLVKFSLGHAGEASTHLYVQTAHRFLGIPIGQFTGDF